MKFYKSMFRTMYFWLAIYLWCVAISFYCAIITGTIPPGKYISIIYLTIIFLVISALFMMIRSTYYIVIDEKELIMRNAFCPLLESSFNYNKIEYIKYTVNTKADGFIIVLKDGKRKFYPLGCVRDKDYPQIINMLQAKGVKFKDHEFLMEKH